MQQSQQLRSSIVYCVMFVGVSVVRWIATMRNCLSWYLFPASHSGEEQPTEVSLTENQLQRQLTAWYSATALSTLAI